MWAHQGQVIRLDDQQATFTYLLHESGAKFDAHYSGPIFLEVMGEGDRVCICLQPVDVEQRTLATCKLPANEVPRRQYGHSDAKIASWLNWRTQIAQQQLTALFDAFDAYRGLPHIPDPAYETLCRVPYEQLISTLTDVKRLVPYANAFANSGSARITFHKEYRCSTPNVEISDRADTNGGRSKLVFRLGTNNPNDALVAELDRRALALEVYSLIEREWPDAIKDGVAQQPSTQPPIIHPVVPASTPAPSTEEERIPQLMKEHQVNEADARVIFGWNDLNLSASAIDQRYNLGSGYANRRKSELRLKGIHMREDKSGRGAHKRRDKKSS